MQIVTGYLTNVRNPEFSGIAQVHIRSKKHPERRPEPEPLLAPYSEWDVGEVTVALVDAGYGVRRLVDIFDGFSERGQHTLAAFNIDDDGMIAGVKLLDGEDEED